MAEEDQVILLERIFKIWCRDQVSEYHVTLSPRGLQLRPLPTSNPRTNSTSCCRGCLLKPPRLEVRGEDIVACRPAQGIALNTRFNMGPPVFMLITYSTSKRSQCSRHAFYFHWSRGRKSSESEPAGTIANSSRNLDTGIDDPSRVMARIGKVKDSWVRAIHELFLPWRLTNLTSLAKFGNSFISQKVLVVLNPVAGNGSALKKFKEALVPVFGDAGIDYELLVTEYPGHAYDVVQTENLARWRAAVVVAGDGSLAEILNGLFDRVDWQDALGHLAICGVPVGGGRHAFAKSLLHANHESRDADAVMSSVVGAAKGKIVPLDLVFVQTKHFSQVSVLGLGWGSLTSKVKVITPMSKGQRLLGRLGLRRVFQLNNSIQCHSAVLSYLPTEAATSTRSSRSQSRVHTVPVNFGSDAESSLMLTSSSGTTSCSTCSNVHHGLIKDDMRPRVAASSNTGSSDMEDDDEADNSLEALLPSINQNKAPPPSSRYTYTSLLTEGQLYFRSWQELDHRLHKSGPFSLLNNNPTLMKASRLRSGSTSSSAKSQKRPRPHFPSMPSLPKALPKEAGWITEVGDFVAVHLLNLPFIDSTRNLASDSRPNDGVLWLLLIRGGVASKDLTKFVASLETLDEPNWPQPLPAGIELLPVRGMRLAPLSLESEIKVDGETAPCDSIQAFVMPGVARTLMRSSS